MSQERRLSIPMPENMKKAFDALSDENDVLRPHLISLTLGERQGLPKLSEGTLPFVQRALEYPQKKQGLVPVYVDVSDLKADVQAVESLLQIFRLVEQLYLNLNDSITLSGSEAFLASLAFYNNVKHATKSTSRERVRSLKTSNCISTQFQTHDSLIMAAKASFEIRYLSLRTCKDK